MPRTAIDVAGLHPMRSPFTLLGRIEERKLRWGGQFVCSVQTSVGHVLVRGNREVLLDVEEGSWLALQLKRDEQGVNVLSYQPSSPLMPAAWLPSERCTQPAVLKRLRHLLGRLGPAAQALFMAVMANAATQRRFFARPAASDHHAAHGGLFTQSVCAAELAYAGWHPNESDREAATLAALLFDIGKLADPAVIPDFSREGPEFEPHPLTWVGVATACDLIEPHNAGLELRVRSLLVPGEPDADPRLRAAVERAVTQSWRGLVQAA